MSLWHFCNKRKRCTCKTGNIDKVCSKVTMQRTGQCEGALQFVKRNEWSRGYSFQDSLTLLPKGMNRRVKYINSINRFFIDQVLSFWHFWQRGWKTYTRFHTLSTKHLVLWTTPKTFKKWWRNLSKELRRGLHSVLFMTGLIILSCPWYFHAFVSSLNHGSSSGANNGKRRWSRDEGLDGKLSTCSTTNCNWEAKQLKIKLDFYHQANRTFLYMSSLLWSQQILTTPLVLSLKPLSPQIIPLASISRK